MATIPASDNEFPEVKFAEGAAPAAPASGLVIAYAKSDGLLYSKDDAGAETALGAAAHIADTSDAHDASAISVDPTGLTVVAGTDVQTAIGELDAGIAGGGIPAAIIDAKGDLIAGTAADTAARLAVAGTNGYVLAAASGETTGLIWQPAPARHGCLIYHNTTQTVSANYVPMNSEVYDSDGYHSTVSSTHAIVIPAGLGGLYLIEYGSNVSALAAGEFLRIQRIVTGPTTTQISTNNGGTAAVGSGYISGSCVYLLNATDTVALFFTGNRTLGHASAYEAQSHLSATLIGV